MNVLNRLRRLVSGTPPTSGTRRTNSTRRRVNAKPPANTIRRTNSGRPSQSSLRDARRQQVTGGTARTTGTGTTTRTARPATATSGTSTGRGAKGATQGRRTNTSTRTAVRSSDTDSKVTAARNKAARRQQIAQTTESGTYREAVETKLATRSKPKTRTDKTGVTHKESGATTRDVAATKKAEKGSKPSKTRKPAAGTKEGHKTRKTVSKETRLTKAQRDRRSLTNRRDIGPNSARDKLPRSTSKTATQAERPLPGQPGYSSGSRGPIYGPKTPKPKATNPSQKNVGTARTTAESAKSSARQSFDRKSASIIADRKAKLNKTPMSGRERQKAMRALDKQRNQASKRVGDAAYDSSLRTSRLNDTNRSPSVSRQEIEYGKDPSLQRLKSKSTRDTQAGAERLSKDMSSRKAKGQLRPITQSNNTSSGPGLRRNLKDNKAPLPTKPRQPEVTPENTRVGTRTNLQTGKQTPITREISAADRRNTRLTSKDPKTKKRAVQMEIESRANRELTKLRGKKVESTAAPVRSAERRNQLRNESRRTTNAIKRERSQSLLQRAESHRAAQQQANQVTSGRMNREIGKTPNSSRSAGQNQAANETMNSVRQRAQQRAEMQRAFQRGASGAGSRGW